MNNLTQTQTSFYAIKDIFPQWNKGIIGRKPKLEEYEFLLSNEVFLYMGHGDGASHFTEKDMYRKNIHSLMMLFGCSSVAMCPQKTEQHGTSYFHLINQCPCLVGCLWTVTDKDVDKLTKHLFETTKRKKSYNLSQLLGECRTECKYSSLTGAAVVVFGIPCTIYYS